MFRKISFTALSCLLVLCLCNITTHAQAIRTKDSVIYRIVYRDTIVYRHDTVRIRHYVFTSNTAVAPVTVARKKRLINPNSWGIGPSVGAYYSPFNGFDVNIGFGVQHYFLAVPSFRNPHMKHARTRR
jgi:hypothetical protein